jgi:hypothetical protein
VTSEPSDVDLSLSYDPETDSYRGTFESATVAPTVAVVEAMAAVEGTDPTDLRPIYDAIDPQGLDRICTESVPSEREGHRSVEFTYHGYRVTVESVGLIEIREPEDGAVGGPANE